jgi:large subunit ribosomal protein L29
METTKIRDLGDEELKVEAAKAGEQIFRLRFNLTLGQKEGVKKLREAKVTIARIKTIERERALEIRGAKALAAGHAEVSGSAKATAKKGKR